MRTCGGWKVRIAAVLCVAALGGAGFGRAAESAEAGLVVDTAVPAGASAQLVRQGAELALRLGTIVRQDDVLRVRGTGSVTVQLVDGTEKKVDGPADWTVPAAARPGLLARVLHGLEGLLDRHATTAANAATRGAEECLSKHESTPFVVPVLKDGARVVAGTQPIAFGWAGGCPPFRVVLASAGGEIAHADGVAERTHEFAALALPAGAYRFTITDHYGFTATRSFEAVARGPVPARDLPAGDAPAARLGRALWLAGLDGGTWRLEAVKTLRPLVERGLGAAVALRDALLAGQE